MLGYDGTYIKLKAGTFTFVIEPSLESPSCSVAWTQLVSKILVLPSYYLMVENYIAKYQIQKGIICQSLCGALRYLIKEYKLMVVQLDELTGKEGLGLQAMWYYIQKIMKIMESLVLLIREA